MAATCCDREGGLKWMRGSCAANVVAATNRSSIADHRRRERFRSLDCLLLKVIGFDRPKAEDLLASSFATVLHVDLEALNLLVQRGERNLEPLSRVGLTPV